MIFIFLPSNGNFIALEHLHLLVMSGDNFKPCLIVVISNNIACFVFSKALSFCPRV